ncbi:peroxisomal acyl-coenzyme A oxidase 1-like [Mizuhopecten yessoensis]|uniref:Acyl-coenzyme A oxidase n=1 Tax=Mizuhopecten yessoensis TaxID=6573 RepID=A0A210QCI3_MIZYE|nr:peroxisomal acyl-coenzyme A oxidase 1-like [Mizuhopecten yessoensis]OWF46410.1 Peroxisomal acyl-coenzyme A oxidase 1 [Mizuhopecten yessoensis]
MASAGTGKMTVNPDIAKERRNAGFHVENLTNFIYHGPERVRRRRYMQNIALQDPVMKDSKPWAFRTREEEYELSLRKQLHVLQRQKDLGITDEFDKFYYNEATAPNENNPVGLHFGMFIPTIEKHGTEEQKKKFVQPAKDLKIIGTYVQTELGHGTFIRGLETTATFDPKTQEFIVDTPTLSATKYWPGNLGKTVNYCILMAQLYSQGKCQGPHMFLCPLRDLTTHQSLPGVELGDIGPKFGFNANDNGYLRLNNFRIPRINMLMRYSKVLEDGTYVKPANSKLSYGSMVMIRASIVGAVSRALAQACVISVRYSAVRRQTEVSPGGPEAQILDYQTQQYKLFPLVATAYAYHFAGQAVQSNFLNISKEIEAGNLQQMPVLHALSAGLKAFSSWGASAGIEVCRMSCGGHGYSLASGLPKIYTNITPACTYEGENSVMMLQTARYLFECAMMVQKGQRLPDLVSYLSMDLSAKSCMTSDVALGCLVKAYQHRAARLTNAATAVVQRHINEGQKPTDAFNMASTQLTWAARAHCHQYVVKVFVTTVTEANIDDRTKAALTTLCKMYAVNGIMENLGEFLQDQFFNTDQVDILTRKMMTLLADVRPDAVALVDAFDYHDKVLDSCLGRYDGNVYYALYEYAKSSPLNEKDVLDSFHKYIKPLREGQATSSLPSRL